MRRMHWWIPLAVLGTLGLGACASLPPGASAPKPTSRAFAAPLETTLGVRLAEAGREHPADSAFRIISAGIDGFSVRLQLIEAAERSLDLQYFIFHQDETGSLLSEALLRAADRGVRVRLLIDDGATLPGDGRIRRLAAHPRIELRWFNPFVYRGESVTIRAAEFLARHARLDFRMHNKLLVADGAAALIGGRNIGDQYFQIDPSGQYADDDVFVGGPTVRELAATFDEYWNSALAIPVEALPGGLPTAASLAEFRRRLERGREQAAERGADYLTRALSGDPLEGILSGRLPLVWSHAEVVCDSAEKERVEDGALDGHLMYRAVARAVAATQSELIMITPYFVPTTEEMKLILELRRRNVRVRILTNSLDSTTELSAQSGYERYRMPLLRSGVELYELRSVLGNSRGSGQSPRMSSHGTYGLHAKLFVYDRQKLFIGSMNFDQRSMRLNTEVGLIISSPQIAEQTAARFDAMTQPANAYQVVLRAQAGGRPRPVWITKEGGRDVQYAREPSRSVRRRVLVRLLALLPLDGEL